MKKYWKILFFISLIILILTNIYWIYTTLNTGVGHSYYKVSCEEYKKDVVELKKIVEAITNKEDAVEILNDHKITFDTLYKGEEFIIRFESFALSYHRATGERVSLP